MIDDAHYIRARRPVGPTILSVFRESTDTIVRPTARFGEFAVGHALERLPRPNSREVGAIA